MFTSAQRILLISCLRSYTTLNHLNIVIALPKHKILTKKHL